MQQGFAFARELQLPIFPRHETRLQKRMRLRGRHREFLPNASERVNPTVAHLLFFHIVPRADVAGRRTSQRDSWCVKWERLPGRQA